MDTEEEEFFDKFPTELVAMMSRGFNPLERARFAQTCALAHAQDPGPHLPPFPSLEALWRGYDQARLVLGKLKEIFGNPGLAPPLLLKRDLYTPFIWRVYRELADNGFRAGAGLDVFISVGCILLEDDTTAFCTLVIERRVLNHHDIFFAVDRDREDRPTPLTPHWIISMENSSGPRRRKRAEGWSLAKLMEIPPTL